MIRLAALVLVMCCASDPILAENDSEEIALLREQIRILSERLDRLEQSSETVSPATAPSSSLSSNGSDSQIQDVVDRRLDERLAGSWTESIRWKGDFRYRYENIAVEGQEDRNRSRIRARAHLEAQVDDDLRVGLGLASGGDDPVSTNQTLGGGGSTKDINLDLAYFQWSGLANTDISGGKFKNPLFQPGKNGLLWDSDWNPEGTAFSWDNGSFFAAGLGTWVESDSNTLNQEFSYGFQAGWKASLSDDIQLILGGGYYRFDTAGGGPFFGDDDDFFGNSFDPITLTYLYDYHEVEAFAELNFGFLGTPLSIFADYVTNLDAEELDTGYAFGVKTGRAREAGSWDFSAIYEDLEADAVFGLLTDSDFGGGGTNARGYILQGTYAFRKNWNAKFTYFINDIDLDSDNPQNFDRLQLDLNFKY